jgi:hypothetical protein
MDVENKRVPRGYLERYVHVDGLGTSDMVICCTAENTECMKSHKLYKGRLYLWLLVGFKTLH